MDSWGNDSKWDLLSGSKWCLPKNAYQVIRSMLHIDFRLSIFQFLISRFWSTICKLTI